MKRLALIVLACVMVFCVTVTNADEVKVAIAKKNVIIRVKPSASSDGQKTVKEGEQMTLLDGGTTDWAHVQYGSIKGYVSKDFISFRYVDPDKKTTETKTETKTETVTETKTSYKTEKPDWYKDNMSAVIPRQARFQIKDVKTGIVFEARRWAGSDHMDVEPVSAKDTALMKKAYNGSWSWDRRPILILYRGHVYAASMNGMPHEDNTISGNDFDGHFCIHFLNSKTHGSDKVDSDHQYCVTVAARASW